MNLSAYEIPEEVLVNIIIEAATAAIGVHSRRPFDDRSFNSHEINALGQLDVDLKAIVCEYVASANC